MNVSSTALSFHAEKNAMPAAITGGSKIAPSSAARKAPVQFQVSRRNAAAAQLPATASTMAGPAKTSSSTKLKPDFAVDTHHNTQATAMIETPPIHIRM